MNRKSLTANGVRAADINTLNKKNSTFIKEVEVIYDKLNGETYVNSIAGFNNTVKMITGAYENPEELGESEEEMGFGLFD